MTSRLAPYAAAISGAALCCLASAASAQTSQVFRNAEAVAGKVTRLGVVSNLKKDCKLGAPAEVKVVTAPKNGALEVRDGKVKTSERTRCPNLEISVKAILYKAPAKFRGEDQAVFEIKNADGELRSVTVKINVSERPAAAPKSDGQDL
jgi:hypothetical protein